MTQSRTGCCSPDHGKRNVASSLSVCLGHVAPSHPGRGGISPGWSRKHPNILAARATDDAGLSNLSLAISFPGPWRDCECGLNLRWWHTREETLGLTKNHDKILLVGDFPAIHTVPLLIPDKSIRPKPGQALTRADHASRRYKDVARQGGEVRYFRGL